VNRDREGSVEINIHGDSAVEWNGVGQMRCSVYARV
jgi:hypothetical protein